MLWKGRRQSENVEDMRGAGATMAVAGGGVGMVILALIVMFLGGDPTDVIRNAPTRQTTTVEKTSFTPEEQEQKEFVSVVLADTEDAWKQIFHDRKANYREPKLVLFTDRVESACGFASAAVGPFYCGEDEKVYIDLSFYKELKNRFHATGDFAQAYVIAHEIGHHVQNQLGILDRVHAQRSRMSKEQANALAVRLELQADFFAGVWARHAQKVKKILDKEDLEEAIQAAGAIGDDKIQMQSQGYVVPESFTHGTAEQRVRWFRKGWESGNLRDGDTFQATNL